VWQSIEISFASDHPTAAGHFPSNPIIPGAVLLDEVIGAIAGKAESDEPVMIRAAKFFRPVRPGEVMRLQWQALASGAFKFECHLPGPDGLAAAGTVEIGRIPP
jgi:3-hydroxyacyl-[acyl-carrier-protein] dehydratase